MEDQAIMMLEGHRNFVKEQLVGQVSLLRDRMERVLHELDKENPVISSCGEVQGLGAAVDTRCAEFALLQSLLDEYKGRRMAIEEQIRRKA